DFLAALKNNKGYSDNTRDGQRQPTVDGPNIPKGGDLYPRYSPPLDAPSPQPKPLPKAPTIEEANFSTALSALGSLINFDKSASAGDVNYLSPQKREIRDWLQNFARNLEDQTGNLAALNPPVENLPKEFLVDRDLWALGFKRIVHPMDSPRHQ